jgi:hypothetical protein
MIGNTLKLRGTPKALATKLALKGASGQVNCLGYGHNARDATMGDPHPSP